MISETIITQLNADQRWWVWFIAGLAFLGVVSFLENGEWQSALQAPLAIATFISVSVVVADLLLWLLGKGKLGKSWYIILAVAALLLGILSLLGNPIFLVLLSFLVSGVLLIVGFLKQSLYQRYGKR